MTSPLELTADSCNAASVVLAGINSRQTWWTGIIGCVLFAMLFYNSQLYADMLLQVFFLITSAVGWYRWLRRLVERPYNFWILCAPDFPFFQDGTRVDDDLRMAQNSWFK